MPAASISSLGASSVCTTMRHAHLLHVGVKFHWVCRILSMLAVYLPRASEAEVFKLLRPRG
eukprot:4606606-Pleurochrysis_carterae.AAC.1